ncbi:MAG: histidine phosphatase family protein [Halomonas sp.]|nr:histidine phosphatase family protein [Halomonas sp.]
MAAAERLAVVLVRHGLTAWNRERRYLGHHDIALLPDDTENGLDGLRIALASMTFDAIHCSDLRRCRQTLAGLELPDAARGEVRFDARLRELDFGAYEGLRYDDLEHDPGYRAWIDSQGERAPPKGESARAFHARVAAAMDDLLARAEALGQRRVLVITHGGGVRSLRQRHEGLGFWDGGIAPGQAHTLSFTYQGTWQCIA